MDPNHLTLNEYLENNCQHLEQLLLEDNLLQIPMLNYCGIDTMPDNTLVRFRGMIQDIMDPEYYTEKYVVQNSDGVECIRDGRYRDKLVLNVSKDSSIFYNNKNTIFYLKFSPL